MKKLISLLLVLAMVFCLSACEKPIEQSDGNASGSKKKEINPVATIITNDGQTVYMTAQELMDAYDKDLDEFNRRYDGAKITFEGSIKYVDDHVSAVVTSEPRVAPNQVRIVFNEGWCLTAALDSQTVNWKELRSGYKRKVTTSIIGAPFDSDLVTTLTHNNRVVWLIGDDPIFDVQYSNITTEINPL